VGHLKHSTKSDLFKVFQNKIGMKEHKLLQEMWVRWNTGYHMLNRISQQSVAILQLFDNYDFDSTIEPINRCDFQI
jgi:hypothetical protein